VRLWTLQLAIIAALLVGAFSVSLLGTPKRIREMCRAELHKDKVSGEVCRDFSTGYGG
jgi:hypothetical protein